MENEAKEEIKIQKFDYIDALRGLAICGVFLTHLRQHISIPFPFVDRIFIMGQHGVQLFFIVSAFTLCLSIEARETLSSLMDQIVFFLRRYFRIAPLYYVAIFLYASKIFFLPLMTFPNALPKKDIVLNLFFLHGFSRESISSIPPGGWSIAAEIMFYLALPTLLKYITTLKQSLKWFFLIFTFSFICKIIGRLFVIHFTGGGRNSLLAEEGWYFYFWFPNQLPVFMLGIIGFYLIKEKINILKKNLIPLIFSACLFAVLAYQFLFYYNEKLWYPTHLFLSFGFLSLLLFLHSNPTRVIVNQFWIFMGKISFGIYLFHFMVFLLLDYYRENFYPLNDLVYTFIALVMSVLIAYFSYTYIELKGVAFGKNIIKKIS